MVYTFFSKNINNKFLSKNQESLKQPQKHNIQMLESSQMYYKEKTKELFNKKDSRSTSITYFGVLFLFRYAYYY